MKDPHGRVMSPVLRVYYICPICDATGDKAHNHEVTLLSAAVIPPSSVCHIKL